MPLLEMIDVTKRFGTTEVLGGGRLAVEEGEIVAVVGYSGAGKTTLVNLAAGLVAPDSGEVRFDGTRVAGPSPARGVVFQTYALLPWLTVEENVRLAVDAVAADATPAERSARTASYVRLVGLGGAMDKRPAQLSGGMRQRVSLARALAMESRLLLLDEPLGALDALTRAQLQEELATIVSTSGRTMVVVTNDVDEAIILADRIVPLEHGPRARFGPSFAVTLPRPRRRADATRDPAWRALHMEVVSFLRSSARARGGESRGDARTVESTEPTVGSLAEARP